MFTAIAPMLPILIENFAVRFRKKKKSANLFPFISFTFWRGIFFVLNGLAKKKLLLQIITRRN